MICVEMRNKKIGLFQIYVYLPQAGLHGLKALFPIQPRINDHISF